MQQGVWIKREERVGWKCRALPDPSSKPNKIKGEATGNCRLDADPFSFFGVQVLTLTHTSTTTHLSSTSNIFAKFGLMKLKICRHTTSRYYYRFVSFFKWKEMREKKLKKLPPSRWLTQFCRVEFEFKLFWTVTRCDWSKGGSWSMCGSGLVVQVL